MTSKGPFVEHGALKLNFTHIFILAQNTEDSISSDGENIMRDLMRFCSNNQQLHQVDLMH